MGQEEQMKLEVIQKEENKKLVTKQTEGGHLRGGRAFRSFRGTEIVRM
jgi:hypothetical protein